MSTQGLVTVMSGNEVLLKVVAGVNGFNARKVADRLKASWPVGADKAYQIAKEESFGCDLCLVAMTARRTIFHGEGRLGPLYKKTFQKPRFNPRWECGLSEAMIIVRV